MSSPVQTVSPDTPISSAHQLMKQCGIRRLPVVKHDRLVGIVTIGDIREAKPSDVTSLSIWEINYLWAQLTVDRMMSVDIVTVTPETSMLDAAQIMLDRKISGLPVLDKDGALVGMLTESDIFKLLITQRAKADTPAR